MHSLDRELVNSFMILILALWGGLANYLNRLRYAKIKVFNILDFAGVITTSGFTGVVVFLLCKYNNIDQYMTAALVGISGHMGIKLVHKLEVLLERQTLITSSDTDKEK